MQEDHSGKIFFRGSVLVIDLAHPTQYGGVEFDVRCAPDQKVRYRFTTPHPDHPDGPSPVVDGEFTIQELVSSSHSKIVAGSTNRIFVERAPGDDLKFIFDRKSLVFDVESNFEFSVAVSRFCTAKLDRDKSLELKLFSTKQPKKTIWKLTRKISPENRNQAFRLEMPDRAGVYDLVIDLIEPSKIPFAVSSKLRTRKIQFVVVDNYPALPVVDSIENLELIYENIAGQSERTNRSRFKTWEKLNSSARDLIFKHLPIPSSNRGITHFEVVPDSFQLFPLMVNQKQLLLKIDIEYEFDHDMICDFVVFDRRSKKHPYTQLVSATVDAGETGVLTNSGSRTRTQSLTTWSQSLTPILLAKNLGSQNSLRIKKIQVFKIKDDSYEFNLSTDRNRRILTQFSSKDFFKILAAPKAIETEQFSLDDWRTFQTGGQRLVKLIKASNFQGSIIDINEGGSAIYPSRKLQFTPAADTGTFARSGRDPIAKDVLELLFRQFAANGLTLIPRIELPRYVAKIERSDSEFSRDARFKREDGTESETYNHLDHHVQQLLSEIVLEVAARYSHHESYGGISLKLGANRQLVIGEKNGYNDHLVDAFLNQKTIKLASTKSSSDRRNIVHTAHGAEFKKWRAQEVTKFLTELNHELESISHESLMLDLSALVARGPGQNEIFPDLNVEQGGESYFRNQGFELQRLREAGLSTLVPTIAGSSLDFSSRRTEFAFREGMVNIGGVESGNGFSRQVAPRLAVVGEAVQLTGEERLNYEALSANSNASFRRELVLQIASNDSLLAIDNFELGQRALESQSKRVWKTFARLPNVVFENVTKNNMDSPVVVRKKVVGDQGFFYVVNQSPWPIRVNLVFATALENPRTLDGRFFKSLSVKEEQAILNLELQPYDLIGGISDQEKIEISDVKFSFPENLPEKLEKKKDQLLAQIRFVKAPPSLLSKNNPGFEFSDERKRVRDWDFPKNEFLEIEPVDSEGPEGSRILSVTSRHESHWGWIRSQYLPSTGTGRLSVLVSMKIDDSQKSPRVRLSVDGNANGEEYYRFGSFSADQGLAESARLGNDWKVFAVHFNDVPTQITNLRVGLDIYGKGLLYVDDFKVFDRWFDTHDKDSLTKLVTVAAHNISAGEYLKAHRLLESYWPKFLQEYNTVEVAPTGSASQSTRRKAEK
ncbi:MAG: hypothetical protein VX438_13105 [Planctomycetota bacterium]|nr:hypothetical protein [Planctomycetota bacterium]